jgi:hypothetical protein
MIQAWVIGTPTGLAHYKRDYTEKKFPMFPSLAGMSLTKLSLAVKN